MKIIHRKSFTKALEKLAPNQRQRVGKTIKVFEEDPHTPQLDNHALHGKLIDLRSISVGGDLRIIFFEENNYEVVYFVFIGTHSQLY